MVIVDRWGLRCYDAFVPRRPPEKTMSLLEVDNLSVNYGAIEAIRGCTLRVDQGEIVTLIGGNGAGKSTTLRTISGLLTPKTGTYRIGDVANGVTIVA